MSSIRIKAYSPSASIICARLPLSLPLKRIFGQYACVHTVQLRHALLDDATRIDLTIPLMDSDEVPVKFSFAKKVHMVVSGSGPSMRSGTKSNVGYDPRVKTCLVSPLHNVTYGFTLVCVDLGAIVTTSEYNPKPMFLTVAVFSVRSSFSSYTLINVPVV